MNYQESRDALFQSYLDVYCKSAEAVEFIISSQCDQKCEYCYLQKHGVEMNYPRANHEEDVLNNLKLFLDYLEENNYQYKTYDIFSGEFFQLPYWEKVFQIFYDNQERIGKKERFMSIPTNYSFCGNAELYEKVIEWIEKFREVNCSVHLSCSIDGPEETEKITRPNQKLVRDDAFYDRVCKLIAKYSFAFHPMISKHFLKDYKKNYDWLLDKVFSYNMQFNSYGTICLNSPMLLEVRDTAEWDEESLHNYKDFLNYVAEKDLELFYHGNKEEFAIKIFDDFSDEYVKTTGFARTQPYILNYPYVCGNKMSCSIQHHAVCRLGDLTMAPCHRLYYSEFEYGNFIKNEENTKIIGVHGLNSTLGFKIKTLNPIRSNLKCGGCKYRAFCLQGCLGSQYENTTEIFANQDAVCNMFETKYTTIHEICEKYGLYDIILNNPLVQAGRKEFIKYARNVLRN